MQIQQLSERMARLEAAPQADKAHGHGWDQRTD
jgi:hypothetical protein